MVLEQKQTNISMEQIESRYEPTLTWTNNIGQTNTLT